MSGTILVTGGTIGDFVVDGLTKKGKKVRVSRYKKQSKSSWDATGIEQVEIANPVKTHRGDRSNESRSRNRKDKKSRNSEAVPEILH